jgi:hypothetical protein
MRCIAGVNRPFWAIISPGVEVLAFDAGEFSRESLWLISQHAVQIAYLQEKICRGEGGWWKCKTASLSSSEKPLGVTEVGNPDFDPFHGWEANQGGHCQADLNNRGSFVDIYGASDPTCNPPGLNFSHGKI